MAKLHLLSVAAQVTDTIYTIARSVWKKDHHVEACSGLSRA